MSSQPSAPLPQASGGGDEPLSLKQPVWQVLVLSVVTFKIYFIYWCYKNWRDLSNQMKKAQLSTQSIGESLSADALSRTDNEAKDEEAKEKELKDKVAVKTGKASDLSWADSDLVLKTPGTAMLEANSKTPETPFDDDDETQGLLESLLPTHLCSFKKVSPLLRTIFVVIPYINHYMFYTITLGIAKLQRNSIVASHPIPCSLALVTVYIALSCLCFLPKAFYLMFLLSVIPVAIVQHWLNRYWDTVEKPGLLMRHGLTLKEILSIIAGALALGYLVSSYIMGVDK